MNRSGTRGQRTLLVLGTAFTLFVCPLAAQERAQRQTGANLRADSLDIVQALDPAAAPTRSLRDQIERVRAAGDKLEEELAQLARLRRDLAERLSPPAPVSHMFENTVQ